MDQIKRKDFFSDILKIKQIPYKEKLLPLLVILVMIFLSFFVLRPIVFRFSSFNAEIKANDIKLSKIVAKRKMLQVYQLPENQLLLESQIKLVSKYLPSSKPSLETLMTLIDQARSNKMQFSGISLNPGEVKTLKQEDQELQKKIDAGVNPKDNVTVADEFSNPEVKPVAQVKETPKFLDNFDLNFSVIGNKQDIEKFIDDLKQLSPMMRVNSFSIKNIADNLFLEAKIDILVYYQTLPEKLPNFDEPLDNLSQAEKDLIQEMQTYLFAKFSEKANVGISKIGNPNPFSD